MTTLAALLERWRVHRHPALADAIDRLDAERPKRRGPRGSEAFQERWLEVAANPTVDDVGWLAETFASRVPIDKSARMYRDRDYVRRRYAALLRRVEALQSLAPDPRLSQALLAFVDVGKYPCGYEPGEVETVYGGMLEQVARIGDVRSIEVVARLAQGQGRAINRTLREGLAPLARRCLATLREVRVTEPEDLDALRPASRPAAHDASALYEAILASPEDRELRAIYADVLLENADPRGRFVALQLRGDEASGKSAARLLREHKDAWLGRLLSRVLTHVRFEDGFLVSADLGPNPRASRAEWQQAAHDERLATVLELGLGQSNQRNYLEFLLSEQMRSLRSFSIPAKSMFMPVMTGLNGPRARSLSLDFQPSRKHLLVLLQTAEHLERLQFKTSKSAAPAHLRAIEPLRERGVQIEVFGCSPEDRALFGSDS